MISGLTSLQAKVLRGAKELLCDLKPGDNFPPERELAVQSGMGRAVVRGMLATLQQSGLVDRANHRWILLRPIPDLPASEEGSKRQRVKDFLLAELGSGRWCPGDQVSELALAKQMGVATVSIREALLEMMPLGLLTKRERQRWEVATFSDERIREMREFREMVEIFSLGKLLVEGLSDEQQRGLMANKTVTKLLIKQRRPALPKILQADLAFHRLLLGASGNSLIQERAGFIYLIIEFQLASPFYTIENGKLGLSQHLRIIEAILSEDRGSAERFLIEHLRSAEQVFCGIVQRSRRREPLQHQSSG